VPVVLLDAGTVNGTFDSDGFQLARHLSSPVVVPGERPGAVLICHGFPTGPIDARQSAITFPELCDRTAHERSLFAMTFTFRGCGQSEGEFSLAGWANDLRAAIDHIVAECNPSAVWLVGNSTGGSLALCVAVDDSRVSGVAIMGARASFDDWAAHPRRLLEHARAMGAISRTDFPPRFDAWARELHQFKPTEAAAALAPRPLLVLHGDEDENTPVVDARLLATRHGAAELRILPGAGHRLRHDPRAVSILLGWLDRQRR
jgi:uncharacterized protein